MTANVLVILGTVVVPLVVICFVAVVTFVNLYLNIRRRFPAKVNCWFCNTDTRVPYDQLNSFVCPTCRQYNGFTADGDYNREIPEQYQLRLNKYCYHQPANITDDDKWGSSARSIAASGISATPRNGLCFGCNRNQELKIHQLASFVPEIEDNYDAEVEEYRKQLEQAYKLCGRCERILKRTLNDVKRNILGSKLAQIGSRSLKVLDMHMVASTKQLAHLKRQRWAKVCVFAISGLLLVKLSQDLSASGWTVADLILLCPPSLLSSLTVVVSYVLALKQLIWKQVEKLLSEPAVQHTTERVEVLGQELFLRYAPQLMQCSVPLFESFSEQVPTERSSPFLLNGAIMALGALLASLGSQRTAIKQLLIFALCATDCILKYMQYQDSQYHFAFLLTLTAFALAISCIGQRVIRSDVARGSDMNSSFHKIYSQQCSESDYSDVDTTASQSPSASFQRKFSPRISTAPFIPRPGDESWMERKLHAPNTDTVGNLSRKSLDTTKSGSPFSLSMSPTNSFFMNSYAGNNSKISGSLFNVTEVDEAGLDKTRPLFGAVGDGPPPGSLLKAPSFSVDDFQTSSKFHQSRWNQRKCVTPSISSTRAKQFRYSLSTIGQEPDAFREDDPLIEDDIDRLSISGRVSMKGSRRAEPGTAGSRVSLTNGNPFAQVKPSRAEFDYDEIPSSSLRQRRIVRPRAEIIPTSTRESLWSGFLASGQGIGVGGQQAHMSRTSSQSSGFESQAGTTRRNTPTEGDVLSVYTTPEVTQLASAEVTKAPPSPVPSSASVFHNQRHGSSGQVRSLFGEQSLFNHTLQQKPSSGDGPSGLFFPKYNHFASGGTASTASTKNRYIFPPQQSQTPSSYQHHSLQQQQQNHNHLAAIGLGSSTLSLHAYPTALSNTLGAAGFQQDRPPSVAGTSFYTSSNQPTVPGGRASLLNLSQISHEPTNGTILPTV